MLLVYYVTEVRYILFTVDCSSVCIMEAGLYWWLTDNRIGALAMHDST